MVLVNLLARSGAVSVAVPKAGGELVYPIGRTRGNATNFSLFLDGKATPNFGISVGDNCIR